MKKIKLLSSVILILLMLAAAALQADTFTIDATQNCIFLNQTENNIPKKSVKVKLEMNTRYRVELGGDSFYSNQTGKDADYMSGVVIFYATNEEDGFRSVYQVLKPGQSIEFTTPNEEPDNVFLIAFVIDYWPESINRGAYTLKVTKI
jgi:hypothetical protein